MRGFVVGILLAAITAFAVVAPASGAKSAPAMIGFTPDAAAKEQAIETRFDAALNAKEIGQWIETLSSAPNQLGSPHDKANAERVLALFKSWGFDARLATYRVLFPVPKTRSLELVAPTRFKASLTEPPVKGDRTSYIRKGSLPPYNAFSADGDVTAELVYVNQGVPKDYEELAHLGVSVKGKIVIARYGGSWRGIKPKVAHEHGAIGCILYSDPKDDGYAQGAVWPEGPWRSNAGVQRGSVMNMTLYSGDPLTPGVAATAGAKRLSIADSPAIKKIPVLPISYGDALPLLKALGGPVAPPSWRGALPITYHVGPGPAKVHLKLAFDWQTVTAYDVIAKIRGSVYPDQWVMRGNHRDAWVFGAEDPLSGTAAILAEARAIGGLLKTGWRPKRTIVYMSWDGEEEGLFGSTEWVEEHAAELSHNGAIYINSDTNARGFLYAGGSASLQAFIDQVAAGVGDPETGVSVMRRARAHELVRQLKNPPKNPDEKVSADPQVEMPINALGSGSDYSSFLDHLGIASLNLGFGGEGRGGQYHSRYDSWDWYRRFGDPGFHYGVALAKVAGHAVLRFANADVLPYSFGDFAKHVADYAQEIEKLHAKMQKQTAAENALIEAGAYKLAADPTRQYVPPQPKAAVPALDFKPLDESVARLEKAAAAYDAALAKHGAALAKPARAELNETLIKTERQLLYTEGLPLRKWYRDMIYAPGYYTGYGVKTLPGIREAVEERKWDQAKQYIGIVANVLNAYSARIEQAASLLKGAG